MNSTFAGIMLLRNISSNQICLEASDLLGGECCSEGAA